MVAAAPEGSVKNGTWKNDVFSVHEIREVINKRALDGMVQHVRELQIAKNKERALIRRAQNKRIYIGPGRDGKTDDKISVDVKFDPSTTKITCPANWKSMGYRKTTFMLVDTTKEGKAVGHHRR